MASLSGEDDPIARTYSSTVILMAAQRAHLEGANLRTARWVRPSSGRCGIHRRGYPADERRFRRRGIAVTSTNLSHGGLPVNGKPLDGLGRDLSLPTREMGYTPAAPRRTLHG